MLHETRIENDIARMQHVEGVEIPPGETVELAPGGTHVMFMRLAGPFREEDRIDATLIFEKAGRVAVEFHVQAIGADAPAHEHGQQ